MSAPLEITVAVLVTCMASSLPVSANPKEEPMHSRKQIPDRSPHTEASPADSTAGASEVVARYVKAIGGREACDAVRTVHVRSSVAMMGLTGVSEIWRESPDRTRETMTLGTYELVECVDGKTAWRIGIDGKLTIVDGREVEDARANAWFDNFAWLAPDLRGGRIARAAAPREASGSDDVIEVTPPVGHPRELWFDAASGLLSRVVETRAQPVVTTDFSDYRPVNGVLMAHRVVRRLAGMPANTLTMTVDSAGTNEALDPQLFIPAATKGASIHYFGTGGSARIPFLYSMNHIWVRASVNGGPPADFILDSGAGMTVVDTAYAAQIGLVTTGAAEALGAGAVGRASLAHLESLRIGAGGTDGVDLADRPVAVLPIAASISPALWRNVAGLLGADIMRDFVVDIDYDQRVLTLTDTMTFRATESGSPVPFTLAGGIPVVPVTIDGHHRGNFRVDLGAGGGAVLQPSFVERESLSVTGAIDGSGGGFGGRYPKQYVRMKSVQLGPLEWPEPLVTVTRPGIGVLASTDYDGVIGNLVLQRFRCTFDYERRVLYLKPGALAEVPDPFTRIGLAFARSGDEVSVLSVMSGSPADQAGVQAGDVVRSIDDRPAGSWDPDRLRRTLEDPECHRLDLVLSRKGTEHVVVVHAKRLL